MDGYTRTAWTLAGLDAREQEWFLNRFDEEDRRRVGALLRDLCDPRESEELIVPEAQEASAAAQADMSDEAVIQGASFAALAAALRDQPAWPVALLLGEFHRHAHLQRCVDELPAGRAERVRALIEPLRETVKPKVRAAVCRHLARRIERARAEIGSAAEFESLLANLASEAREGGVA